MTILHLISSEGFYGAEAMLITLARNSAKLGCANVIGVFEDSRTVHMEVGDRARESGLPVESIPCKGRWDWGVVRTLRQLVEKYRVDVLHTHGYKADVYGYLAAWPRRTALAATCHNWPSLRPLMRAYARLDQQLLRHFDGVAPVSGSVLDILGRAGVGAERLRLIPNGVEWERFSEAQPTLRFEQPRANARMIGFVGRLIESKGGAVLLDAARKVLAEWPDAIFVFAGSGPLYHEWQALANDLGIAGQVVFVGSRSDMPGVYASLDMFVLPSFVEAAPMCVLEAMAAGRPVIATRVGSVPKMVIPGQTGILVDPGDADGLAEAILLLLREPELAKRLGQRAQTSVASQFSAQRMTASYLELYRHITAARPKASAEIATATER